MIDWDRESSWQSKRSRVLGNGLFRVAHGFCDVVDYDTLKRHNVEAFNAAFRATARSGINQPRRMEMIDNVLGGSSGAPCPNLP